MTYDVGVLVVHGIGTQAKGTTVKEWTVPVTDLLERLGGDAGSVDLPKPPVEGMVDIHTPKLGDGPRQRWLVHEAWWAEAFTAPGRNEVSKWLFTVGPWFVLYFVARLWARFHVRARHAIAGLATCVAFGFVAHGAVANEQYWWKPGALGVAATAVALLAVFDSGHRAASPLVIASLVLLAPIAAVAEVAMVALWVVGLLPGPWSKKVRSVQVSMSRSVGDVWALISNRNRELAMHHAITNAAEELLDRVDQGRPTQAKKAPLVICAHSLGAALTFRMFNGDPAFQRLLVGRKVTWITHGSAIIPVHVFDERRRGGALRPLIASVAGFVGLILTAATVGRLLAGQAGVGTTIAATASAVLLIGSFLGVAQAERDTRSEGQQGSEPEPAERVGAQTLVGPPFDAASHPHAIDFRVPVPSGAELRWVDLWAPWDPVPNGPLQLGNPHLGHDGYEALPKTTDSAFLPCRVANDHQPWTDHVVYRTSDEDVVIRWIGEIAMRAKGVDPVTVEPFEAADDDIDFVATDNRRNKRMTIGVTLLSMQGLLLAAAVAVLLSCWNVVDDLGRWANKTLPSAVKTAAGKAIGAIPVVVRNFFMGAGRDPSRWQGVGVGLAATALLGAGVSALVGAWRRQNSKDLTKQPRRTTAQVALAWGSWAAFVGVIAIGVMVSAWNWHDARPQVIHVTAQDAKGAPVAASLLVSQHGSDTAPKVYGIDVAKPGSDPIAVPIDGTRDYDYLAISTDGACAPVPVEDVLVVVCPASGMKVSASSDDPLDLTTSCSGLLLWTGLDDHGVAISDAFASQHQLRTLNQTLLSKGLAFPANRAVGTALSAAIAARACGEVDVLVDHLPYSKDSTFAKAELPALRKNKKVTKIVVIDAHGTRTTL